jgi:hypothetical protein
MTIAPTPRQNYLETCARLPEAFPAPRLVGGAMTDRALRATLALCVLALALTLTWSNHQQVVAMRSVLESMAARSK